MPTEGPRPMIQPEVKFSIHAEMILVKLLDFESLFL
jgi:hypothetical protein